MVKKLQRKFVFVTTISVAIMILGVLIVLNITNYNTMDTSALDLIQLIEENNGVLPKVENTENNSISMNTYEDFSNEAKFDTKYFVVYYNDNKEILFSNRGNVNNKTAFDPHGYAEKILDERKSTGYIDGFKFKKSQMNELLAIIFLDVSSDMALNVKFLYNSIFIGIIALVVTGVVSYILSPFAIKPIVEAYEKQKQFITNASHEIKTPLSIISANIDILEMQNGKSKWTKNSKEQVGKLTKLVNSLTALARMDERKNIEKTKFSISEVAEMASESFESMASASEKTFLVNIEKDIEYVGNESNISQLLYIILDNAFKYTKEDGTIHLKIEKVQDKIHIYVENMVEYIEKGSHKEFFDRFYREDVSRNSKKDGFGIGLSLAKSIVSSHKGTISAKSKDNQSVVIKIIL